MTTFYIVRHGETEWNLEQRLQGWLDSPLTQRGKEQASSLSAALRDIHFDACIVSSSGRALETARLLLVGRAVELMIEDSLREIYLGNWQGKRVRDILMSEERTNYLTYSERPELYIPSHTESFEAVTARAIHTLSSIAERFPTGKILVVSHGVTVKCIVNYVQQLDVADFWAGTWIEGTSVTELFIDKDEWRLGKIGCTAHLN